MALPSTADLKSQAGHRARRVLYLSYDGMTDPLGRSQVLPYLTALAARGHEIVLISFEKAERAEGERQCVRNLCAATGIEWHPQRYSPKPPILSTLRDLAVLRRVAFKHHRRHRFELVHCRSYLTALVGLAMKRRFGVGFLFDMRGFYVEERVEMGLWPQRNPLFRAVRAFFKAREAVLLRSADAIVILTNCGRRELAEWTKVGPVEQRTSVIPCCVDFDHFDPADGSARRDARSLLGLGADTPVLLYLGSLGGNHMLDEMLGLFRVYAAAKPAARFLFVTHHDPDEVRRAAMAVGVAPDALIIRPASRDEVPALSAAADLGVAFKQPNFSAKACSPTKLGEMLALGIPVIANRGVGDVGEMLDQSGAGVAIDRFDQASYAAAITAIDRITLSPDQIRAAARRWFALEDGVAAYDAIYARLGAQFDAAAAGRAA